MRNKVVASRAFRGLLSVKWSLVLIVMGFLLGKAMILQELSPFAAAYFAVIFFLRRDLLVGVAIVLPLGSLFAADPQLVAILAQLAIFYCLQRGLELFERAEVSFAPVCVFFSVFAVKLFSFSIESGLSWYGFMMTTVEASLGFILTLIFLQAVPALTIARKNNRLKNEEIICLVILLASVLTGTVGWTPGGISIENVMSRYLILLFALAGGAPIGASVGVIMGLILSLADVRAIAQMSVLAFSGLLAGLLKEGKRIGVSCGMLLGSTILALYIGDRQEVGTSIAESGIAVVLLLLTPRMVIDALAKFVPGTQEFVKTQHDYARRVRDVTAGRVQQFSEVFSQLAVSFKPFTPDDDRSKKEEDTAQFMNEVAGKACQSCYKRRQCWDEKFSRTYTYMSEMISAVEEKPDMSKDHIRGDWKQACVKTEHVLELVKHQRELYKHNQHWKRQINDSRLLVADQLSGVSQVMQDLAKEIQREGQELYQQEEQIRAALEQLGLSIHSIEIISLDEGNVEIEIVHQYTKGFDECRKIIAPLLSDILNENIVVRSEEQTAHGQGIGTVLFASAKEFEVETGFACAAKGGGLLSGDSFSLSELGNGKFAVAVSDGMGNGERAKRESSSALMILEQLLLSGMDEKLAVKSVNSVLLLRSADEMFTTIDLALIDLYTARTTFLKIGSTPCFIKRGMEVIPIMANNLPAGILQEIDIEVLSLQLKPNDILILMTDGIYDAPGPTVNKELWMKRILSEIIAETPQDIADCLLETVVRHHHGEIVDDMTVVVARIDRYQPEWKTVRWQTEQTMQRPKTVS